MSGVSVEKLRVGVGGEIDYRLGLEDLGWWYGGINLRLNVVVLFYIDMD